MDDRERPAVANVIDALGGWRREFGAATLYGMTRRVGRASGELSYAARVALGELGELALVLEADARRAWNNLARAAAAALGAGASVGVIAEAAGLAPTTMRNLIRGVLPTTHDQRDGGPG